MSNWVEGDKGFVRYQRPDGSTIRVALLAPTLYPCIDCGKLRTKEQGGTVFTVCDECWNKSMPPTQEDTI